MRGMPAFIAVVATGAAALAAPAAPLPSGMWQRIARPGAKWTLPLVTEAWNRDTPLLAIHSHMIQSVLYLCDDPLGRLIAFQIEEHLKMVGVPLAPELERTASFGSVAPDVWMEPATGAPVGTGPLLRATAAALEGK